MPIKTGTLAQGTYLWKTPLTHIPDKAHQPAEVPAPDWSLVDFKADDYAPGAARKAVESLTETGVWCIGWAHGDEVIASFIEKQQ